MLIQHKMSKKQKQVPQKDDKNCQINRRPLKSNKYADKKSQVDKKYQISNMQPVKPQMDVQSKKPAMEPSNKKSIGLNKNCKDTICENIDPKSQTSRNSDKNCQENKIMLCGQ